MSVCVCVSRAQHSLERTGVNPPTCLHDVIMQNHNDTVFSVMQATAAMRLSHDVGTDELLIFGARYHSVCQRAAAESTNPAYTAILSCLLVFSRQTQKNWWAHSFSRSPSLLLVWLWKEFCNNSSSIALQGTTWLKEATFSKQIQPPTTNEPWDSAKKPINTLLPYGVMILMIGEMVHWKC